MRYEPHGIILPQAARGSRRNRVVKSPAFLSFTSAYTWFVRRVDTEASHVYTGGKARSFARTCRRTPRDVKTRRRPFPAELGARKSRWNIVSNWQFQSRSIYKMKPRDSSPFVQVFVNISTIFFMQFIEELIPKLKLHLMDGIVTWIENFFFFRAIRVACSTTRTTATVRDRIGGFINKAQWLYARLVPSRLVDFVKYAF